MRNKVYGLLVAIWFILWGLLQISNLKIDFAAPILGILAVAIGICIFLDR